MSNENFLLNQLSLLLAGSGMSNDQMIALLNHLKNVPQSTVIEQVNLYRNSAEGVNKRVVVRRFLDSETLGHSKVDIEAINNVQRLLILEAGMSKSIAANEILNYLKNRHPSKSFPSFNSKEGFSKWLSQIAELVSLSELLHVASALRNRLVHTSNDDWIKSKN